MPRFYFDIREGTKFVPDAEGLEYPSVDAAELAAAVAAGEISRDVLPRSDARAVTIEVKNEHRQRIITVTVTMDIDRVDPVPSPPSPA